MRMKFSLGLWRNFLVKWFFFCFNEVSDILGDLLGSFAYIWPFGDIIIMRRTRGSRPKWCPGNLKIFIKTVFFEVYKNPLKLYGLIINVILDCIIIVWDIPLRCVKTALLRSLALRHIIGIHGLFYLLTLWDPGGLGKIWKKIFFILVSWCY